MGCIRIADEKLLLLTISHRRSYTAEAGDGDGNDEMMAAMIVRYKKGVAINVVNLRRSFIGDGNKGGVDGGTSASARVF